MRKSIDGLCTIIRDVTAKERHMQKEIKIYTGKLMYRDIEFTFVFDKTELRLIPPSDSKRIIRSEWLMKSIAKGVYVEGEPLHVEEPYTKGED